MPARALRMHSTLPGPSPIEEEACSCGALVPLVVGRVYIRQLDVHMLRMLVTITTNGSTPLFPYTLDVYESPIVFQGLTLGPPHGPQMGVFATPRVLLHTTSAYYMAEGMANAPQILGEFPSLPFPSLPFPSFPFLSFPSFPSLPFLPFLSFPSLSFPSFPFLSFPSLRFLSLFLLH